MWIFSLIPFLFIAWYTRLMVRYTWAWKELESRQFPDYPVTLPGLSILIALRNELENADALIACLKSQTHPAAEIILIDDQSTDGTLERLQLLCLDDDKFKILRSNTESGGKKNALRLGIESSRFEHLLFTDADTRLQPDWAVRMHTGFLQRDAVFLSGPVQMSYNQDFFSRFQAMEFAGLIAIGAAAIQLQKPNMCNGANLMYSKKAYREVGGFNGMRNHPGGDDQFMMHRVFERYPHQVYFLPDPEAIVYTKPERTLRSFIQQRIRWASKNGRFERKEVSMEMSWLWVLHALILGQVFLGFAFPIMLLSGLLAWTMKGLMDWYFYRNILGFFRAERLIRRFAIAEIIQVVYVFVIGLLGKFASYNWKGRSHR